MMTTIHAALIVAALAQQAQDPVQLRFDTSQAEAVLAVVARHQAGEPVGPAEWQALFATEPYRRLKQREASLQRAFSDEEFQRFVLSDELAARADDLRRTLDQWRSADLDASARRVLAYLPPEARIRASVYPVIKPRTNSFVYELLTDPAIFLYLDPDVSGPVFENTVAHELHHVGFASVAATEAPAAAGLDPAVRTAVQWMGAFGEGFAVLAAAGDADTHPHAHSPPDDRARWDRDVAGFDRDLRELEAFFLDVIEGRLATDDAVAERAFTFFGEQGPWYTVGYRMAVVVEQAFGRDALLDCMLDPRRLLARYNAAVAAAPGPEGGRAATWSPRLLDAIGM